MDKLIVKGLGRPVDGEYEFDFSSMLGVGTPDALTNREGHRIKLMSGVRAGELEDALMAGDNDVMVAFAAIVLARNGKTVDEDLLWDAPMGAGLSFELGEREGVPPAEPAETPEPASTSGGESPSSTSGHQENDPSPTTPPDSEKSAESNLLRSVS